MLTQEATYERQLRVARQPLPPTLEASPQRERESPETSPREEWEVFMDDPRHRERKVKVLAFDHPGWPQACDRLCRADFLSNSFALSKALLMKPNNKLKTGGTQAQRFKNAEAAFQALKHWALVDEFVTLTGQQAREKGRSLHGQEDHTYAMYGDEWVAML